MTVPEIHLQQIAHWCQQHVPARARHQVRVEYTKRGASVTIVEVRAPWRETAGRSGLGDRSRSCVMTAPAGGSTGRTVIATGVYSKMLLPRRSPRC